MKQKFFSIQRFHELKTRRLFSKSHKSQTSALRLASSPPPPRLSRPVPRAHVHAHHAPHDEDDEQRDPRHHQHVVHARRAIHHVQIEVTHAIAGVGGEVQRGAAQSAGGEKKRKSKKKNISRVVCLYIFTPPHLHELSLNYVCLFYMSLSPPITDRTRHVFYLS